MKFKVGDYISRIDKFGTFIGFIEAVNVHGEYYYISFKDHEYYLSAASTVDEIYILVSELL